MNIPVCQICKEEDSWPENTVDNQVKICNECKTRLNIEILLVCDICDSMCFIPKTYENIKRLQFFVNEPFAHYMVHDTIIQIHGCPHCVSFKNNALGERKEEYMASEVKVGK